MSRRRTETLLRRLANAILMALLFSAIAAPDFADNQDRATTGEDKDASSTVRVATKGNELSIVFPVAPEVYRFRDEYAFDYDGVMITEEKVATSYVNGVVYMLELLKTGRPQRALSEYLKATGTRDKSLVGPINTQPVTVSGNPGTQRERRRKSYLNQEQYYRTEQCFATKDYILIVSATARDGATPEIHNFFSSLKFGDGAKVEQKVKDESSFGAPGPADQVHFTGDVYEAKGVTRQAVVVWQPPLITDLIRVADDNDSRRGEIQVRVVLTPAGEVADIKALQVMSRSVTEMAVEITRRVKFIPAELNGRAVAQVFTFKYNLRMFG